MLLHLKQLTVIMAPVYKVCLDVMLFALPRCNILSVLQMRRGNRDYLGIISHILL